MGTDVRSERCSPGTTPRGVLSRFRPGGDAQGEWWLHRLAFAGIAIPVVFLVLLALARPHVRAVLWPDWAQIFLDVVTVLGVVVFGSAMALTVRREHRLLMARHAELDRALQERAALIEDLDRSRRHSEMVCDVLWRIARHEDTTATLSAVASGAQELLTGRDAGVCLDIGLRPGSAGHGVAGSVIGGRTCVYDGGIRGCRAGGPDCPAEVWCGADLTQAEVQGRAGRWGQLWVARSAGPDVAESGQSSTVRALADLAAIALEQAEVGERTRHAATLAERDRIAREMHDSLAQVLGASHLRLLALAGDPKVAARPGVVEEIEAVADLCHDAYRDVREAILGLRTTPREDHGLLESLRTYVAKYARQAGIDARLDTGLVADPALSPHGEVQVIRVVQEALTNIRKHAAAECAVVRVSQSAETVLFEVEDDGRGFDLDRVAMGSDGFGLRSMQERTQLAGGRLTIDAAPGRGTRVRVAVPRCHLGQGRERVHA
ncbi:hypothetical protein KEM60_01016 [Austwickia sp. TVS 96-490-7B]|uniref:sensor histidine kinase n=1 Tax=Austwickia sp. TVS 96-490-7B TaxID=2830843 RepID=UPI001C581B7E|nr:sensor histidine kinase [Austwickia sp. TVS 96-490-7B]MBW3084827.1 hypothetical protein [Austwickia sp. TVS 96-490-7B]